MKIPRSNLKPIIKKKIDLNNLIDFKALDMVKINELLNEVISENTYNTLDLLTILIDNYDGDFRSTVDSIKDYKDVRFNCYHACKLLKSKLDKLNIKSYLISYKSIGFSNSYGDNLIKEAHMSLVIPTLNNKRIYYILLDPGLRIPEAMCFYEDAEETTINIDNDIIKISKTNDDIYGYTMEMTGYNRYSLTTTSYSCQEYFDINHELVNPEEVLFPASYYILNGYRVINFNVQKTKTAVIKFMIINEYLECVSSSNNIKLSFNDLKKLSNEELVEILKEYTDILNVDVSITIKTIKFIVNNIEEFKKDVIDDLILD